MKKQRKIPSDNKEDKRFRDTTTPWVYTQRKLYLL